MRKTLLTLLGLAALAMPVSAGEPVKKPLEEVVKKERFLKRIEFEKYDDKTKEIVLWLNIFGEDINYSIKAEVKKNISEKDRDGKKVVFNETDLSMDGKVSRIYKKNYAIKGTKPVLISTKVDIKEIPKRLRTKPIFLEPEIKRPSARVEGKPFYLYVIEIKPLSYSKGELLLKIPQLRGRALMKQKLNLEEKLKGDRKADFSVLNYVIKKGKMFEIIQDYDIRKDNSFELRIVTERLILNSEINDYNVSTKYKLIPIEEANVDYQGMKIKKAYFEKGNIVMKVGEKTGTSKFDPVKHYGRGILPDFVFFGNGKKHYARVNRKTLQVEVYVNKKGKVDFSEDMFKHVPRIYTELKDKKDII